MIIFECIKNFTANNKKHLSNEIIIKFFGIDLVEYY